MHIFMQGLYWHLAAHITGAATLRDISHWDMHNLGWGLSSILHVLPFPSGIQRLYSCDVSLLQHCGISGKMLLFMLTNRPNNTKTAIPKKCIFAIVFS